MKAQAILILMSLFSFVAAWAQAPAKAAEGTVKGSFTMNGKTVPLTHVYALVRPDPFEEKKDVVAVYLTDAPVDEDTLRDEFGLFEPARDGKLHAIEVRIDVGTKEVTGGQLYHKDIESGSMSVSGMNQLDLKQFTAKQISGHLTAGPEESFDNKWEYSADFSAPVWPKPVETAAALDSPPAQVALAFVKAAQAKDKAGLKKVIAPEMAAQLDGPEGAQLMAMLPQMFPPSLKLTKVVMQGANKAIITFKAPKEHDTTTVKAALVNGEWRISK
ncbi:MAG TPA: hypothetical protein VL382_02755 [Terriglobales bacterium]|nr:hypothetical protein [Terriglobales bacterium]